MYLIIPAEANSDDTPSLLDFKGKPGPSNIQKLVKKILINF